MRKSNGIVIIAAFLKMFPLFDDVRRKIERMTNGPVCNGIQFNTHRIRLDAHDDDNDDGTHTHLWKMRRKKLRIVYVAGVS